MINGPRRSRIGPKLTEIRASKVEKKRKTYGVSWTQVGGAEGSLRSRDHWRAHDGFDHQFDEWDLTFPKFPTASSKVDAIRKYYDAYDADLTALRETYGARRVLVLESPKLFEDRALQKTLFAFLGLPHAQPVTGLHANAQTY